VLEAMQASDAGHGALQDAVHFFDGPAAENGDTAAVPLDEAPQEAGPARVSHDRAGRRLYRGQRPVKIQEQGGIVRDRYGRPRFRAIGRQIKVDTQHPAAPCKGRRSN
jgi:hypothetical protein